MTEYDHVVVRVVVTDSLLRIAVFSADKVAESFWRDLLSKCADEFLWVRLYERRAVRQMLVCVGQCDRAVLFVKAGLVLESISPSARFCKTALDAVTARYFYLVEGETRLSTASK